MTKNNRVPAFFILMPCSGGGFFEAGAYQPQPSQRLTVAHRSGSIASFVR
jgi:hypothetical protein